MYHFPVEQKKQAKRTFLIKLQTEPETTSFLFEMREGKDESKKKSTFLIPDKIILPPLQTNELNGSWQIYSASA